MTNYILEIEEIELDFTSFCNLRCPKCSRFSQTEYPKLHPNIELVNLDYNVLIKTLDSIKTLKKLNLCGNYGDSTLHPRLEDLIVYCYHKNIRLKIETNGYGRDTDFWTRIAKYFPIKKPSEIIFSIDGLEDTNHLYRINSKWENIYNNFTSFINANGRASWKYIIFEHNEHQIEEAKELAKNVGFTNFMTVYSNRYSKNDVIAKRPKFYKPLKQEHRIFTRDELHNSNVEDKFEIKCKTKPKNQVFISHDGKVFPCCRTANQFYLKRNDFMLLTDEEYKTLGNTLSLSNHNIYEIINNDFFSKTIVDSWASDKPFKSCLEKCGKMIQDIHTNHNFY